MNPPVSESVFLIEVAKISPNPFQPRRFFDPEKLRELASSIREYGILQPLVVTKVVEETPTGTAVRYELIAGERRFRASSMLGLERVPAIIKNVSLDRHRLELAIIENVQRDDLNAIDAALAYSRLQDEFNLTQREIANRIGKSREVIANTLRLLNLPSGMQKAVSEGRLMESQARLLLSLENISQQEELFNEIIHKNLSVRELKAKIEYVKSASVRKSRERTHQEDAHAKYLRGQLEEMLGTPVRVERSGDTGKITIEFFSPEELEGIVQRLATGSSPANFEPEIPQELAPETQWYVPQADHQATPAHQEPQTSQEQEPQEFLEDVFEPAEDVFEPAFEPSYSESQIPPTHELDLRRYNARPDQADLNNFTI